eukprot:TRINITY_DN17785_c0_g1_i1.p1 TRINITY_DN17785_c0_g1~~TRINITY_DN17785_c0_g1_i1.p1  ORF type:complete len:388 (+),score=95.08 TRINITY_DN17785_c0_g1_i1:51-1214(+)
MYNGDCDDDMAATMPVGGLKNLADGLMSCAAENRDELDDLFGDGETITPPRRSTSPQHVAPQRDVPQPAVPHASFSTPPSPGMQPIREDTLPLDFDPLVTSWGKLGLTRTDWDYLRAVHSKFDADKSGDICRQELGRLCKQLCGSRKRAEGMMKKLDVDKSGHITVEEFARQFIVLTVRPEVRYGIDRERFEEMVVMFRRYDCDGDGLLSWTEFRKLATERQLCRDVDAIDRFFTKMDADGNGHVDLHEFLICSRAMKVGRFVTRQFKDEDDVTTEDVKKNLAALLGDEADDSGSDSDGSGDEMEEGSKGALRRISSVSTASSGSGSLSSPSGVLGRTRKSLFSKVAETFYRCEKPPSSSGKGKSKWAGRRAWRAARDVASDCTSKP